MVEVDLDSSFMMNKMKKKKEKKLCALSQNKPKVLGVLLLPWSSMGYGS
jgi:hypothetical protein